MALTDGMREIPWPKGKCGEISYWDAKLDPVDDWARFCKYRRRRRRVALAELYELAQEIRDPRFEKAVRALKDLGADEWLKVKYRA